MLQLLRKNKPHAAAVREREENKTAKCRCGPAQVREFQGSSAEVDIISE